MVTAQQDTFTEAELENRVSGALASIFPAIEIRHQRTFTVQIGRNQHEIGKKNTWAKGRADILVKHEDKPLAIVELKAPGEKLGDVVDSQAVSYARLHEPMVPLVVVTNGAQTRMLTSYDRKPFSADTIDEQAVQTLVERACELAAADHDEAVRAILDRDDQAFAALLSAETDRSLATMTGPAKDLRNQIASDFRIERAVVADLARAVGGNDVVVLVGPALSGRTNALSQFCERSGVPTIYLKADELAHGPIRYMANVLGRAIFRALDVEDVRRWFFGRLRKQGGDRIAIVLDGWGGGSFAKVREDVDELLQILKGTGVCLVAATDEVWFESLCTGPTGGQTTFGRRARRLDLLPLSNPEFEEARNTLARDWNMVLDSGSQVSPDYREPRILRLIVSSAPEGDPKVDQQKRRMTAYRAPATGGPFLLDMAWRSLASDGMKDDLRMMAHAAMTDPAASHRDLATALRINGLGAVSLAHAEASLTPQRVRRLLDAGLASYVSTPLGERYLIARVPEMQAKAAAIRIAEEVLRKDGDDHEQVYGLFIASCATSSLPDVVGAEALWGICERDGAMASRLVDLLLEDEPDVETVSPGAKILVQLPGGKSLELDVPPGCECPSLGNTLPYLVLSHFLARPMVAGAEPGDVNLRIAVLVGSLPHVLLRVDPRHGELLGMMTHPLPQGGSAICPSEGAVEPVVEAIIQCLQAPQLGARGAEMIEALASAAAQSTSGAALTLRLWTAFGILSSSTNEIVANAASAALKGGLRHVFETLMSEIHADDAQSDDCGALSSVGGSNLRNRLLSSTALGLLRSVYGDLWRQPTGRGGPLRTLVTPR